MAGRGKCCDDESGAARRAGGCGGRAGGVGAPHAGQYGGSGGVLFCGRAHENVDEWLAERVAALQMQAAQRREVQRRACGQALRSMRERGQSLREIAQMAGIGEKAVRELDPGRRGGSGRRARRRRGGGPLTCRSMQAHCHTENPEVRLWW